MINVGIIEDDVKSSETLEAQLLKLGKERDKQFNVFAFKTADEFLSTYSKVYDIVFLDIEMPGTDGMTAAKKLRNIDNDVLIIFVTNISRLAIDGYAVRALDYLLKPVEPISLSQVMDRAFRLIERRRGINIAVSASDGFVYLDSSLIKYVEVFGHYLIYHTDSGQVSEWGTLKKTEELLAPYGFARCNNCYLVNLKYVRTVNNKTVTVGDDILKMSSSRTKIFMLALNEYLAK